MRSKEDFEKFRQRLESEVLNHEVISNNNYCRWFATVNHDYDDVKELIVQFSVFSNQFLIAQLEKMINAVDLQEMHAAKEILANELGCIFKRSHSESKGEAERRLKNAEQEGDPRLVNTEGTVDGGIFRFQAAHFEWLLRLAEPLGLTFDDLGKRSHGTKSTLFFCDELIRIYGNENFNVSAGASFAVENWAAAGFWKELINGLTRFKKKHLSKLNLSFFTWHDKVEDQHKAHTWTELEAIYFEQELFDEEKFICSGNEMLAGVKAFWDGLDEMRLARGRK
ncbi:MAG: hypothetical protein HRT88_09235 [Lentisphaeraceae bacterium]|nr:hypothetical protein [Lentisphaeraceae bacterium]